jgi:hypothetical protein
MQRRKRKMNYRNLLKRGFFALLGAALLLTGCFNPTDSETVPTAPGTPTVTAEDNQLTVSWAPVDGATAYEVYYGTESDSGSAQKYGEDVGSTGSPTESVAITGLTNGTRYYVWVKAKNSGGTSNFSPQASGTPSATAAAPPAPATPMITAGDKQLTVTWTAVSDATAYELYWHTVNDYNAIPPANEQDVTSGTSTTITGLTNDTRYYVWVKAKNSGGTSDFSPQASGTPGATAATPPAPAAPTITAGDKQLTVTWTAVSDATAYELYCGTSTDSGSASKYGLDITGSVTATITSLTNGTLYYVWVKAKNSRGTSDFSPQASGTPQSVGGTAPATPAAPATPTVSQGDAQLTVTWTAVSGATAYEVWYGTSNSSGSAQKYGGDVGSTSATITGLTNGTLYYVWVKAKNSGGTSDFSPQASGTSQSAGDIAPATPAAPVSPTVNPGDAQLTVTWTAVSGATAYEVWYGTSNSSGSAQKYGGDVGSTSATITSLTNGTLYYVWVKAKNSGGTSGFSPQASGTPSNLDSRLPGRWVFAPYEEFIITATSNQPGAIGTFESVGGYAGDILYWNAFDQNNGVIIIQYWSGRRNTWYSLGNVENPDPEANFYGIYISNINGNGSAGTRAEIFSTSDQAHNLGPTETTTLAAAITKFTQARKAEWIGGTGSPQTKQ